MTAATKAKTIVLPPSGKRLLDIDQVSAFLSMSHDSVRTLQADPDERFPAPLQILRGARLWALEDIERYVALKQKEVATLGRR